MEATSTLGADGPTMLSVGHSQLFIHSPLCGIFACL